MSTTVNVDYIKSVFEYPVLSKVLGKPTYSNLKTLKDELKANAGKIQCELGGGKNGHLGILLSDAEQALVDPILYVRPVHPGAVVPVGATAIQNTNLRSQYNEELRMFREANAVEECLLKQLNDALPPHYLKCYRNNFSNKITTSIRDILTDLFRTYGALDEGQLADNEAQLRSRVFDIQQPLVEMYNVVEELQEIATASSSPYTDRQLVGIGMQLIRNMNDYEKARGKWMAKSNADKTWPNFKLHFDQAYQYLISVRGETMKNTQFQQQANMISDILAAVNKKSEEDKAHIIQLVDDAKSSILTAVSTTTSIHMVEHDVTSEITPSSTPSVNITQQDQIQLKMLQILERIDRKLDDRTPSSRAPSSAASPKRKRRVMEHYCWTHGAGNHKSSDCRNKKEGHKDSASFSNRMGGSKSYCKLAGKL